jgi:hypothetical protein
MLNVTRGQLALLIEVDSNEFSCKENVQFLQIRLFSTESRGVVVSDGLGISKGLEHGVCLDNLIL